DSLVREEGSYLDLSIGTTVAAPGADAQMPIKEIKSSFFIISPWQRLFNGNDTLSHCLFRAQSETDGVNHGVAVCLLSNYSELNLNQYSVVSPCRTICNVCGYPPCPDLNLIHYI
ncbi:MAG: hypothetical protein ACFNKE_11155, partial [Neisseria elongata]